MPAPIDWRDAARLALLYRRLDKLEVKQLIPQSKKQIPVFRLETLAIADIAGTGTGSHPQRGDGVPPFAAPVAGLRTGPGQSSDGEHGAGGFSDGRDLGVVFNLPRWDGTVDTCRHRTCSSPTTWD
jgi:2-oxoisovalerate dehydrogenase E1 component